MAEDFVFGPAELTEEVVAARKVQRSGLSHAHRLTPADPRPGAAVTLHVTTGPAVNGRDLWCYVTTDGTDPAGSGGTATNGSALAFEHVGVEWDDLVWGFVHHFEVTVPGQPDGTLVRYLIECDGAYADGGEGSATRTPYFAYSVDDWSTPEWVRDAVMYYVMPDRFYPGDGRDWIQTDDRSIPMGGTLRGIQDRLGYIRSMGFNTLWLMPWMVGPTYHKYGATDFYGVDPGFGTEADLRALIDDAHARGMHVLVDFVGNHCSDEHPYFVDARTNPSSPYRDWFVWDDDASGGYVSFFGGGELPHIRHNHPDARRYVIDLARHWVREYGIDGYDLDYAVGPTHEFWAEFSRGVREVSKDVVIFTEGVTTPEALASYVGRVDGCQDFAWCQAARRTFGNDRRTVEEFERFLAGTDSFFPAGFVAPTMLDNQNMDRFVLVADGDQRRLRVAAACQYTLSQPLSVWAGTERGMSQQLASATGGLDNVRDATAWDGGDAETMRWFARLGALRTAYPSLRRGVRVPLVADASTGVLAYAKVLGQERCTVVLNTSEQERVVPLGDGGPDLVDQLAGHEVVLLDGVAHVAVPAWSAALVTAA